MQYSAICHCDIHLSQQYPIIGAVQDHLSLERSSQHSTADDGRVGVHLDPSGVWHRSGLHQQLHWLLTFSVIHLSSKTQIVAVGVEAVCARIRLRWQLLAADGDVNVSLAVDRGHGRGHGALSVSRAWRPSSRTSSVVGATASDCARRCRSTSSFVREIVAADVTRNSCRFRRAGGVWVGGGVGITSVTAHPPPTTLRPGRLRSGVIRETVQLASPRAGSRHVVNGGCVNRVLIIRALAKRLLAKVARIVVNRVLVSKADVSKALVSKELVSKELVSKELVSKELVSK